VRIMMGIGHWKRKDYYTKGDWWCLKMEISEPDFYMRYTVSHPQHTPGGAKPSD
jgi:hypothetical protein